MIAADMKRYCLRVAKASRTFSKDPPYTEANRSHPRVLSLCYKLDLLRPIPEINGSESSASTISSDE